MFEKEQDKLLPDGNIVENMSLVIATDRDTVLMGDTVRAVSYTHLDVYKRQLLERPVRPLNAIYLIWKVVRSYIRVTCFPITLIL